MSGRTRVDLIDKAFAEHLFTNYDISIQSPKDIEEIIKLYHDFLKTYYETSPQVPIGSYFMEIPVGFVMLYGPPDTFKTTIAVNIANDLYSRTGYGVVYVDAENTYSHNFAKLDDGIIFIPGRDNTHNLLRKLIRSALAQVIVIDTIYTLSRYPDFLRNINKVVEELSLRILLVNQMRNYRYSSYPAGQDIIVSMCKQKHRIVGCRRSGNGGYVYTDTGFHYVIREGKIDVDASLLKTFAARGLLKRIRGQYILPATGEPVTGEELKSMLKEVTNGRGYLEPFRGYTRTPAGETV